MSQNSSLRFLFLCILFALLGYFIIYLQDVRDYVIDPFTVGITHFSGEIIRLFGGIATDNGNILAIPGFSVRVLDMCNGVEATILLWAAVLAFPTPWLYKVKGLLVGTLAVHAVNIIRIISLLYIGAYKPDWFYWAHWYVWDALIMLDILLFFLAWLYLIPKQPVSPTEPLGA